jgi:pyruvate-formate lyase-activating enzyme
MLAKTGGVPLGMGMDGVAATNVFWTREKLLTRRGVLWLGQTCNIRCHFCYFLDRILTKDHPEHAFMDLDKAKQICHDLRYKYGNTSIDIQGGEPTIWKHINELCRYCADIGLHPTLITNGIALYRRRNVEELKASGVRDLLISVHGLREVYDEIVGFEGGSVKQLQGIENCVAVGLPFRFNAVLSKKGIPQFEEVAHLAVAKGARAVNFLAFNPFEDQAKDGKRTTENVPQYSEVAPHLNRALDILEAGGVEANVRYYPICIVEPRHRKSIYDFQQLPYDSHEWDYNSWTWTGQQPQRMKWGPPSPHHAGLSAETYSSWIFQHNTETMLKEPKVVSLIDHFKHKVDNLLAPMPAARTAARSAYRKLRVGIAMMRRRDRSQSSLAGSQDELGRNPQTYWDHGRVRAFDQCRYQYAPQCNACDAKSICDGFHGDYAEMFGVAEATPISVGHRIDDPAYFISEQEKIYEPEEAGRPWRGLKKQATAA